MVVAITIIVIISSRALKDILMLAFPQLQDVHYARSRSCVVEVDVIIIRREALFTGGQLLYRLAQYIVLPILVLIGGHYSVQSVFVLDIAVQFVIYYVIISVQVEG